METKIVLVENNPMVVKVFTKVLEDSVYFSYLTIVDKFADYLKALKQVKPKMIFTGKTLNGFTANQVLEAKNKFLPKVPAYVLMANPKIESNIELIENGAYDIILHQDLKRVYTEVMQHQKDNMVTKKLKYRPQADNYTKHLLSII